MDRGLSRGLVFEWMKDALRKKNESKVSLLREPQAGVLSAGGARSYGTHAEVR